MSARGGGESKGIVRPLSMHISLAIPTQTSTQDGFGEEFGDFVQAVITVLYGNMVAGRRHDHQTPKTCRVATSYAL